MRLSINIDHIATVRQARGGTEPDPVEAALRCEDAGADGIVCHLREDRRHINDRDVRLLRRRIGTKLDLEMAATEEIVRIALEVVPEMVTLVPEKRQELTTESGLDVAGQKEHLRGVIQRFHGKKIAVSLFVDPVEAQVRSAREIGSDMIEIHTGEYANAADDAERGRLLAGIRTAAELGKGIGLGVNAGHGLNYVNVGAVAAIPWIDELSIGHSIISRALFTGIEQAVRDMLALVKHQ